MLTITGFLSDQVVGEKVSESQEATEINGGKPVGGKPFIPELLDRGQRRNPKFAIKNDVLDRVVNHSFAIIS